MRALIRQGKHAEVWPESEWLPWVDGEKMSTWPMPYALCEDADSDDPDNYVITTEGGVSRAVKK